MVNNRLKTWSTIIKPWSKNMFKHMVNNLQTSRSNINTKQSQKHGPSWVENGLEFDRSGVSTKLNRIWVGIVLQDASGSTEVNLIF